MPIKDVASELVLEKILMELLLHGESPRLSTITTDMNTYEADHDLSKPVFSSDTYQVSKGEASSASKYNNANYDIQQDLKVLYKFLFDVSDQELRDFQRWKTEAQLIENRLDQLVDRVESLLLLSNDTAGYFNYVQDNFTDSSKVDLSNSTALVNMKRGIVTIGTSSTGTTRVDLSNLTDSDVQFTVLTRNNLVSDVQAEGSRPSYAVNPNSNYWQERVYTNKPGAVTAELKIKFPETTSVSRVDVDLHTSSSAAAVQVIVMYSTDNYNWQTVPTSAFAQSFIDKATFTFTPVNVNWMKLVMTKPGHDLISNGLYDYEFGLDGVAFFNEGFDTTSSASILYSKPLSVTGADGLPEDFSRVVLETCETVPTGTTIDYYVGVSNSDSAVLSGINFVNIDPLNREDTTAPSILDFGDLSEVTIEDIIPSFDPGATNTALRNPAAAFTYLSSVTDGVATTTTAVSSAQRYAFKNTNERILDLSLGPSISVAQGTIELWRNVHVSGSVLEVRGESNGWRFEDPYYKTTVRVGNANGYTVDWGTKAAFVDGAVSRGQQTISFGHHTIWVHKDNWDYIDASLVTDLASLKAADSLYPYNHRYIVEGFVYPTDWTTGVEKVYKGFDLVAEYLMQEISIFDLMNSLPANDYSRFAIDYDTGDASRTGASTDPIRVFVIKVDESQSDFTNEQFVLRFKAANTMYKYLYFKAVLSTTDSTISPLLDSYRIKVSS